MFCPMIKEECKQDCAWFIASRRKYKDHVEGKCSLAVVSKVCGELEKIIKSIDKLECTIHDTDFTA